MLYANEAGAEVYADDAKADDARGDGGAEAACHC